MAAIIAVLGALVWLSQPHEPRYQGKTVTRWVEELKPGEDLGTNKAFRAMLRELGSNAAPPLVGILERESGWKRRITGKLIGLTSFTWINRQLESRFITSEWRVIHAAYGLNTLGAKASCVVPRLGKLVCDPHSGRAGSVAVDVLARVGPSAVPKLTQALTNAPGDRASYALYKLQTMAQDLRPCIPAMTIAMHAGDPELRCAAALTLSTFSNPPPEALSVLLEFCQPERAHRTRESIEALEPFVNSHPEVRKVMSSLCTNSNVKIRRLAGAILWRANQTNLASNP